MRKCITYIYQLTASGGQCVRTARENKVESEVHFDSVERNPYRKKVQFDSVVGNEVEIKR
jgi:hypothetical protein